VYDRGSAYPNPQRLHTREADTGRDLGSIPLPGAGAFAVTPDQKHFLYAAASSFRSIDGADFIRAELATGDRLDSLHLAAPVREIVVSPDGRRAAVRGTELFALVDLERWAVLGSQTLTMTNAIAYGTRFAPDGRTVVTSLGPHLRIWDAESGRQLREVRDKGTHVQDIAFTPDGRYALTVSNDATVKVRDTTSWEVAKSYTWKIGKLRAVDISPDGALAATGSAGGRVVVWDVDLL
jgi:WD40 repeat protein